MFENLEPLGEITASLVVDEHGSAIGPSGSSKGLGNKTDLELLIWLRKRSQVILTSGLTARVEEYKLPKSAKLALLTRQGVPHLNNVSDQILWLPKDLAEYADAIEELFDSGLRKVHTEFGPSGFRALVQSEIATGLISGVSKAGVERAVAAFNLRANRLERFEELFVAVVSGRGREEFAKS